MKEITKKLINTYTDPKKILETLTDSDEIKITEFYLGLDQYSITDLIKMLDNSDLDEKTLILTAIIDKITDVDDPETLSVKELVSKNPEYSKLLSEISNLTDQSN
jgi:phage terminase large subunit-like protein